MSKNHDTRTTPRIITWLRQSWRRIRQLSGDDAYERYLLHYQQYHQGKTGQPPPLSREAFFKQWQDGQWQGVKRCC